MTTSTIAAHFRLAFLAAAVLLSGCSQPRLPSMSYAAMLREIKAENTQRVELQADLAIVVLIDPPQSAPQSPDRRYQVALPQTDAAHAQLTDLLKEHEVEFSYRES